MTARPTKVVRRPQPNGEQGVRTSLQEVAKKIAEGRIHPDVRAWATRKLHAAGNPKGAMARSKVLLEALRDQSGWVPDPTDSEFIAAAHLTLGDGEKPPFFALGDCDDLTVGLQSAVLVAMMLAGAESVGAKAAIVGHAYGKDKMVEHVLGAVYDKGQWHYMDPSVPDLPFGQCKPFTREIAISVPSGETLCDAAVCLRKGGPASGGPPPARRGDFVAVAGVGEDDEPDDLMTLGLPDVCDLSGCCGDEAVDGVDAELRRHAAIERRFRTPDTVESLERTVANRRSEEAAHEELARRAGNEATFAEERLAAREGADALDAWRAGISTLQESAERQRLMALAARCAKSAEGLKAILRETNGIKRAQVENIARMNMWAPDPCSTNPLAWQILNVPPSTDYAARDLFQPWHDGMEPLTGRPWLVRGSSFPR